MVYLEVLKEFMFRNGNVSKHLLFWLCIENLIKCLFTYELLLSF